VIVALRHCAIASLRHCVVACSVGVVRATLTLTLALTQYEFMQRAPYMNATEPTWDEQGLLLYRRSGTAAFRVSVMGSSRLWSGLYHARVLRPKAFGWVLLQQLGLLLLSLGLASAFMPPATVHRAAVASSSEVTMFSGSGKSAPKKASAAPAKKGGFSLFGKGPASPTKPVVGAKAKPLSPGSNYPTTKNIQTQKSGFGSFVQKFQLASGKSKYGVPIFLPNGNVNPAYLAAERADARSASKKNTATAEAKRKALVAGKSFELADYVRKKIGEVGSGKDFYQSGR